MELFSGYWNGEKAYYRVVDITVGAEPKELTDHIAKHNPTMKRFLWFFPFIGMTRQAVEVQQAPSEPFYLDNEDGTGVLKVTEGMGSPGYGHRSVYPAKGTHAIPVPREDWIKYFPALVDKVQEDVDIAWRKIDPDGYNENLEQVKRLKAAIQKNRADNPEAFKHLKK